MDAKSINALYANLEKNELACVDIGTEMDTQKQKMDELTIRHDQLWQSWQRCVIDIGKALTEVKRNCGKSWKRDFNSLGYKFSITSANRYIACAKHPELGSANRTVEAWAKASADLDRANDEGLVEREAKRKERAASRLHQVALIPIERSLFGDTRSLALQGPWLHAYSRRYVAKLSNASDEARF